MPTTILNQASLTYVYGENTGTAVSNVASTVITDPVAVSKMSVGTTYQAGSTVTYVVSIANNGIIPLTNITITDNLGAYSPTGSTLTLIPLTYVEGSSLYINGLYSAPITGTVASGLVTFTIPTLASGSNAMIIYHATVNHVAPLDSDATITNTAIFRANGITDSLSDSATVTVRDYADVEILKEMRPNPVSDGETLIYTFTMSNYGNVDATGVVLTDAFNPAPSLLTVTAGGTTVLPSDYSYIGGILTLPVGGSTLPLTVPAATITQDAVTGIVTVVPGTLTVVVTGNI